MASISMENLTKVQHDELCCSYAALLLSDAGLDISAEKLVKVIKGSGNSVDAYWPGLFAKAMEGRDVSEMLIASQPQQATMSNVSVDVAEVKVSEKEAVEDLTRYTL